MAVSDKGLESVVGTVIGSLFRQPAYPFIAGAQLRLMQEGMDGVEAWHRARRVFAEFMRLEGIRFGDPRYAWTPEAGAEIIDEMEIQHWEARAAKGAR